MISLHWDSHVLSFMENENLCFLHSQYLAVDILAMQGARKLTHWGRVMHIWVSKLTIIGSDNGLSPDRRQAIIWTNAGLLIIGPLGTNFSEILIEVLTFSFKKMRLKVPSVKRRPFCLGLNVLAPWYWPHFPEIFQFQGGVSLMFHELLKIFSRNLNIIKIVFLWEFQAKTLYVCPKPCFGHTYKVSAWNSRHKCYFWHCVFSRDYFGELAKRSWNNPRHQEGHFTLEQYDKVEANDCIISIIFSGSFGFNKNF